MPESRENTLSKKYNDDTIVKFGDFEIKPQSLDNFRHEYKPKPDKVVEVCGNIEFIGNRVVYNLYTDLDKDDIMEMHQDKEVTINVNQRD